MSRDTESPDAPWRSRLSDTKRNGARAAVLVALLAALAGFAAAAAPSRHVIYLHGRIVQDQQDARPRHPAFGYYEMDAIRSAFRARGLVVTSEIRPREASVSESAARVVDQVRELRASGVPADHITVVGASMGGGIALHASARLQDPELRFAVLGVCPSAVDQELRAAGGNGVAGRVLAIREASDELTAGCPAWNARASNIVARELVLDTGLRHGFLYRPLPGWLDPVLEWVEAR